MKITIDLNPPTVRFDSLLDGDTFIYCSRLYFVKYHGSKEGGGTKPAEWQIHNAIKLKSEHEEECSTTFKPDDQVIPCAIEVHVSRIGNE